MKFSSRLAHKSGDLSLRARLHKHLSEVRPARSPNVVHASDLIESRRGVFCPREFALMRKVKKKPRDEFLGTPTVAVFRLGDLVHDMVADWFADMGVAVGDWRCVACGALFNLCKRPTHCKVCGCTTMAHKEMRVTSPSSLVSCGLDLVLDLGAPKFKLVEIKSIDKVEFKTLKAPLSSHRWRTSLYLRVIEEAGLGGIISTNKATVFYVSKGGFGTLDPELVKFGITDSKYSPFKEYEVERDDKANDKYVELAMLVKRYQDTGVMPLGVCNTNLHKRAKSCPVMAECWSGDYPGEE